MENVTSTTSVLAPQGCTETLKNFYKSMKSIKFCWTTEPLARAERESTLEIIGLLSDSEYKSIRERKIIKASEKCVVAMLL